MSGLEEEIAAGFREQSCVRLGEITAHLDACMEKLSDEQVWRRGGAHENAVGNLVLHLCGNIQQWVLHGVGGEPDVRTRDAEFSAESGQGAAELMEEFRRTVTKALQVVREVPAARLMEQITPRPGGAKTTVLGAIYHVVTHAHVHTGQVIVLTKQMVGRDLDLTIPRPR